MGPTIKGVMAHVIRLPLVQPYHLSLVSLEAFDSILIRIQADGKEGMGEATDCPGYYIQELADAWKFVCTHGPELPGRDPEEALKRIRNEVHKCPFAATPLMTALESLIWLIKSPRVESRMIPLVGIVQGEDTRAIVADAQRLQQEGYRTLKSKVGFSVIEDLDRVAHLQAHLQEGVRLRLDANQGYDYSAALRFLEGLEPTGIELLEQPLKPGQWEDMARLAELSPIPLMLDEAIAGERDLDQTIESGCARAVKFKLMKCGSFEHLERMIKKATRAGLKVILGNGVATDIGCLHEALIAGKLCLTAHAGEMNGFLKAAEQFLQPRLRVDEGQLVLMADLPEVRWDRVSGFALETVRWGEIKSSG